MKNAGLLLHCFIINIVFMTKSHLQSGGLSLLHPKKKEEKYPHIAVQLQRLSLKTFVIM